MAILRHVSLNKFRRFCAQHCIKITSAKVRFIAPKNAIRLGGGLRHAWNTAESSGSLAIIIGRTLAGSNLIFVRTCRTRRIIIATRIKCNVLACMKYNRTGLKRWIRRQVWHSKALIGEKTRGTRYALCCSSWLTRFERGMMFEGAGCVVGGNRSGAFGGLAMVLQLWVH